MKNIQEIKCTIKVLGEGFTEGTDIRVFSYIEIEDENGNKKILGKTAAQLGFSGIIRDSIGEPVTLFIIKRLIVGIKNSEGFYYSEIKKDPLVIAISTFALGIPLSFIVIGIPLVIFGGMMIYQRRRIQKFNNYMASIPGGILIEPL